MQHRHKRSQHKNKRKRRWHGLFKNVHKITHKQCSNAKGANADLTTFAPFFYAPKLSFGNVY
jgi:hypothetical protein